MHRPHDLTREKDADGVYVRVGSTNRRADPELIAELRRFAPGEGFDKQPMPGLNTEGPLPGPEVVGDSATSRLPSGKGGGAGMTPREATRLKRAAANVAAEALVVLHDAEKLHFLPVEPQGRRRRS